MRPRASGKASIRQLASVLLAVLLLAGPLGAQSVPEADLTARTKHIASQLRCPVCQGLSLQESQSELSQQMKDVIREQLQLGKTDAQVIDYFVAKYGEWILLEPRAAGFNLAVYVLPFLVLIGGFAVLYVAVKRWTAPAGTSIPRINKSASITAHQ